MFERYTERARRVLFFARYEASQLGSLSIETEHLLLGLMREGNGLIGRIFARAHLSPENLRREVEDRTVFREKVSTSVEIPFSAEMKRALGCAAEEADRLLHKHIGTEHLLLGILREERSVAASILMDKGMRLHTVREDIVQLRHEIGVDADVEVTVEQETRSLQKAIFNQTLPHYLASRVVHITHAHSPTRGPTMAPDGQAWFVRGQTLTQIVAMAWGSTESQVRLVVERRNADARYDFTIVLPSTDSPEIIPRLLREAIERDFNVDVTRQDTDPPTIVVRPR